MSSFPFLATSLLERQCNHTRELGDIVKLLLVKLIRLLVANTGVATVMIIVINIRGDADLGIRYIGKDGPVAGFEHLGFEAGPEAFGLGVVVAFAPPAVRGLGFGPVQQGFVGVAHVLPPRSECTIRPGAGRWASSARCKALVTKASGMSARTCQPYRVRPTTCLVHTS